MFGDRIFTTADVRLSVLDRIRVLVSGRVCVRTVVVPVDPHLTRIEAWVPSAMEPASERYEHEALDEWHVVRLG